MNELRDPTPEEAARKRRFIDAVNAGGEHGRPAVSLLDVVDRFIAQVLTGAMPGAEVSYAELKRIAIGDAALLVPQDDEANINDQPGTGAGLLSALVTDAQYDPDETASLAYSDVYDTCPAGVGQAAVAVSNHHTGEAFLLVAVPLDAGQVNRSTVRRLLVKHQPDVARVIAGADKIIDQALEAAAR